MGRFTKTRLSPKRTAVLLVLVLLLASWQLLPQAAYGAQLGYRQLQLSSNIASATSDYNVSFYTKTAAMLGSIEIQFCSNDALIADSCVVPAGMDATMAVLSSQFGQTGFTISPASTANEIILTRAPLSANTGLLIYDFENITNPNTAGSYFVRIQTFATVDASGPSTDYGGIAYAITNNLAISAYVPPYLEFCTGNSIPQPNCTSASGDYIDFGELSAATTSHGSSQMLTATNARDGYTITVTGTTLTSGNNVIAPMASSDVSRPGTSQFGLNLRANTSPSGGNDPTGPGTGTPTADYDQPNFYRFVSGDEIAGSSQSDNVRIYTATYIVNVPSNQPAGVYVSTITYICLATF